MLLAMTSIFSCGRLASLGPWCPLLAANALAGSWVGARHGQHACSAQAQLRVPVLQGGQLSDSDGCRVCRLPLPHHMSVPSLAAASEASWQDA